MQILDPEFEVRLVVLPRHTIHTGGGFALKRVERRPERIDTDMVEERGELLLLPLPCGSPYAAQRLGHASPAPRPVARLCSSASSLLCRSQTSLGRASAATAPHLPATDHPTPTRPMADPEISRFPHKERPYMPGSQTTPGPTGARNNAPADFAFRQVNNVGTRVDNDFAAQWLAYTLPYRRFADVLADACARIGGDVDCYSFIAVDFHHILLASLPAHSLTL